MRSTASKDVNAVLEVVVRPRPMPSYGGQKDKRRLVPNGTALQKGEIIPGCVQAKGQEHEIGEKRPGLESSAGLEQTLLRILACGCWRLVEK